MFSRRHAFTLIELLIVVAIIAILAAIAVPNFLEAQTRAKISRVKSDLRTVDVGLTAYSVDNNNAPYPLVAFVGTQGWTAGADSDGWWSAQYVSFVTEVTSPVAYLTSIEYPDPFAPELAKWGIPLGSSQWGLRTRKSLPYNYSSFNGWWAFASGCTRDSWGRGYLLRSFGPDRAPGYPDYGMTGLVNGERRYLGIFGSPTNDSDAWGSIYDSTNGTVSRGEIVRWGGGVMGPGQ